MKTQNNTFSFMQGKSIHVYVASSENSAVKIAAQNFCQDFSEVFSAKASFTEFKEQADVIIQTITSDDSRAYPELFQEQQAIWEAYTIRITEHKLFIIGTNRRGTIYGIYELSKTIGVSPWYWFADVPIQKKTYFHFPLGIYKTSHPSVAYRGIFLNDEEELEAWAIQYMNEETIGPKTYEKIFELLLRLGANYIWPAMHVNAFNSNHENGALADRMGIVVGTSHCDMLLRSNQNEWEPWITQKGYTHAQYDYSLSQENREIIHEYWRESLEQNQQYEVSYTLGMRGIHDSGLVAKNIENNTALSPEEKKHQKVTLLDSIIQDQQKLIQDTVRKEDTLQTFIPYKEVLELYDEGLHVPENVTLMWVNDNFGYMRRYPTKQEQQRKGGHGLYYHASYWAHPGMSYLFFNSSPLAQMKNELKKAYENGIQKIWVLNVGALKPLEIDISFFLTYAWEINGKEKYTYDVQKFIELWTNETFQQNIGKETAAIYTDFLQITNVRKVEHMKSHAFSQTSYGNEAAKRMNRYKDLFYRTMRLYQNLPASQKDSFFQIFGMKIFAGYLINASFYFADRSILMYQQKAFANADAYTTLSNKMDQYKRAIIHYYNKTMQGGKWDRILTPEAFLPPCTALYPACKPALTVSAQDQYTETSHNIAPLLTATHGFCENDGYISMLASHYEKNSGWKEIPYLGRYEGSLMEAHHGTLTYQFHTVTSGCFTLELYRFPTLNSTGRIRVGVQIDDMAIQEIESFATDEWRDSWKQNVLNHGEKLSLALPELAAGDHSLTLHVIDKYVAVSKLVIYTGQIYPSSLGPQESYHPLYNPSPDRAISDFQEDSHALEALITSCFLSAIAPLPEVIYADKIFWSKPRLYLKNTTVSQERLGEPKYVYNPSGKKNVFSYFGNGVFLEENGHIAFGTEYALENSVNAYLTPSKERIVWEHTASQTDGGTGIAMYVSPEHMHWKQNSLAPALNYRLHCSGGLYNIWLLLKYDDEENARLSIEIDQQEITQEKMYGNGFLFNYGTQQNWVWMIVGQTDLSAGEHLFSIFARASQLRIDRIYLSKTEEYPPIDCNWKESRRKAAE